MVDISVQNIKKAFIEGVDILDGLSFEINEGEHVGLLGNNGAGKTTLFRLIVGEISEDEGDIVIPESKKLGLISQIPRYPEGFTAEDALRSAFDELSDVKRRIEALENKMAQGDDDDKTLSEYDVLITRYEREGGYTQDSEVNRVCNGLDIPSALRNQPFSTLSGGEKTRVNLARLIIENTDILLLDEPTNHLDMRATEWLEDYVSKFRGTVLIVSHDRYFLDRTVTRTIEITKGKAEFFGGNYSFYVEEKRRRFLETLTRYEREQREAKRLSAAADRLYQWGTGNKRLMTKSFAIRKRIDRLVQTDRPTQDKKLKARFGERDFRGDEALIIRGLTKSYGDHDLFDIPELEVHGGERIALIGDNGSGKTTLIKIITGEVKPDTGFVRIGPAVKTALLPQIIHWENPLRSALDTLIYDDNCSPQTARNRLGAYNFSGEDVYKTVGELSGGEQSRLRLCMLMKSDLNLLILDEPTNHLDLPSREWIEEAVSDYNETLLFVSHDRYFIERFATRVWELENGVFTDFPGSFAEFRAYKAQLKTHIVGGGVYPSGHRPDAPQGTTPQRQKQENKGQKPGAQAKQLAKLEREIAELEDKLREIAAQKEENSTDYEKLLELLELEEAMKAVLDEKYEQWETVSNF